MPLLRISLVIDRTTLRLIGPALLLLVLLPRAAKRILEAGLVREMLLRVAAGAALLTAGFWVAFGIDAGRYAGQSHAERVTLVALMMIAMLAGVVLIVSVLWAGDGVFGIPYRFIAWGAVGVVAIVGSLIVGEQLELRFGIYHERLGYVALAVGVATATLVRPRWFWDHAKARYVRDLIGDHATIVLYLLIAGGLGWLAVGRSWGPEHAMNQRGGWFSGRIKTCYQLQGTGVEAAGLGDQVAYVPGYETGFALWLPRAAMGDTARRIAYDGHWYRIPGDTTLIRIDQNAGRSTANIRIAPGAFPRAGEIDLPSGGDWGNVTAGRRVPIQVDSIACAVEIAGHG